MPRVPSPDELNFRLAERAYRFRIRKWVWDNKGKLPGLALDVDDLTNEVLEVLWRAVKTYDPNKGAIFNSWFTQCLNNWFKSKLRMTEFDCRRVHVDIEYLSAEGVSAAVRDVHTYAPSAEEVALAPLVFDTITPKQRERLLRELSA